MPCEDCGTDEGTFYGPCPYAQDIQGVDSPHWLCPECHYSRAMDI